MLIAEVGLAFALVAANGFFVATEFAIARVRPTQVDAFLAERRPGAKSLHHAVVNLDAYLAACQVGITVASIGLGAIAKPAFEDILEPVAEPLGSATGIAAYALSFAFAFGIVTLLHVVVGELAPKSLAIARNAPTALVVAPPMRLFYLITKPVVDAFNWMGNVLLRPFGIPPAREVGHAPHSEDELRQLLRQSLAEGLIDPDEREFAENVFTFGDLRARQIMVPRPEVHFVTTEQSVPEAAAAATRWGHTRLPLCQPEGGLDTAVGHVNAKDLLASILGGRETTLGELARPLERVSESLLVGELLTQLREERRHVALVADEYGTVVGLVSFEDVIEEIVGEIEDEFDPRAAELLVEEDGRLVADGAAPAHAVADWLGVPFANVHEATIGGHLVDVLGRLPERGERIELDGLDIEVLDVGDERILRLGLARADGDGR